MADESPRSSASDDEESMPPDDTGSTDTVDRPSDPDRSVADADPTAGQGPDTSNDDRDPTDSASSEPPEGAPGSRPSDPTPSPTEDPETGTETANTGPTAATVTAAPGSPAEPSDRPDVPPDVQQYDRFKKIDGARYERVNEFLRDRTYITAREWAIARLCADFRTETGSEMTKIGENLPELVPFMTDTYTPQAVNQARAAFENKVRKAGATFLYGAMCDFFTADQLDEVMYEATEVAKFLLEVEGVDLAVEEELEAEDRISSVMREVRHASESLRYEGVECPHCGEEIHSGEPEA